MTWLNFDLLTYEATLFSSDLDDLVITLYSAAQQTIESVHKVHIEELNQKQKSAKDDDEAQVLWQTEQWECDRYLQQMYSLSAMALSLLASRIESLIDQAKTYLDKTHPAKKIKYPGTGKLQRRIAEYQERFGIDLEAVPRYEVIQEVILARNCCIHNDNFPDDNYKKLTGQHLIDEHDRINLTAEHLSKIGTDLKDFAKALVTMLRERTDKIQPTSVDKSHAES